MSADAAGVRLHVVDGTYELFRAHYAPRRPEHRTPDGRPAKATIGLCASLLALLEDRREQVTHLAVAFDNPIRCFRNELFAGYKTDEGVDPDLLAQFTQAEAAVRAMGIVVWSMGRWEADDALATAAARYAQPGSGVRQVRLMTPDKDLGQCLREGTVVLVDRMRNREIDVRALREARGIAPRSVPDWLALVGDSADGIPGVPGFGEKTASQLLGRFGKLEDIPERAAAWPDGIRGAERLARTLLEQRELALLYRRLATLIEDVPLEEELEALAWHGVPRRAFMAACDALGADALRDRPVRWRD